jgi:hypothetical protein
MSLAVASAQAPVDSDADSSASSVGSPDEGDEQSQPDEDDSLSVPCQPYTQEKLEEHLLGIIVGDMNPLSLIDSASFRLLVTLVVGGEDYFEAVGLRYPTAGEVRQMILDKFTDSTRLIKELLRRQSVVATTCDVWKTLRSTFVAVTAHWIDESTVTRFNCFLDVRVIDPSPTGETIATILYEVHREFEVLGKVVYTTVGGSKF